MKNKNVSTWQLFIKHLLRTKLTKHIILLLNGYLIMLTAALWYKRSSIFSALLFELILTILYDDGSFSIPKMFVL